MDAGPSSNASPLTHVPSFTQPDNDPHKILPPPTDEEIRAYSSLAVQKTQDPPNLYILPHNPTEIEKTSKKDEIFSYYIQNGLNRNRKITLILMAALWEHGFNKYTPTVIGYLLWSDPQAALYALNYNAFKQLHNEQKETITIYTLWHAIFNIIVNDQHNFKKYYFSNSNKEIPCKTYVHIDGPSEYELLAQIMAEPQIGISSNQYPHILWNNIILWVAPAPNFPQIDAKLRKIDHHYNAYQHITTIASYIYHNTDITKPKNFDDQENKLLNERIKEKPTDNNIVKAFPYFQPSPTLLEKTIQQCTNCNDTRSLKHIATHYPSEFKTFSNNITNGTNIDSIECLIAAGARIQTEAQKQKIEGLIPQEKRNEYPYIAEALSEFGRGPLTKSAASSSSKSE